MNQIISNAPRVDHAKSFVTWENPAEFAKASAQLNTALDKSRPIQRSTAAIANRFQNIDANTSVRDSFSALDYQFFRPGEHSPRYFRDIIAACLGAYEKVPIIKSTIDLMSDFTSQGVTLVHEDEEIQTFYREWFKKVKGIDRTERIANTLYKGGNVILKRAIAKLDESVVSDWKRGLAKEVDVDHMPTEEVNPFEIPYRYTILNPAIVEILNEQLAAFTGQAHYVLKIPTNIYNNLSIPMTFYDPSILTVGLPRDIQAAIDSKDQYLYLDPNKLVTLFYKRDDWNCWAYPMLFSLLDYIIILQKMMQADITALDGVISHIRIWKLGSLEHKIFPTDAAISKLSNILLNHVAGGAMDFIWGPDLELDETSTDIGKWIGGEKYEFIMESIHGGLGLPTSRSKGSVNKDFMSIRVLLERLKYGRQVITDFWDEEIRIVQKAMNFKKPAVVQYGFMQLEDEAAEKALWLQLVDRDIIPVEAVQERFGRIPEIDNLLIKREYASRDKGNVAVKVSPYVDAQPELSLTKIGMQRGVIMPSQLPDNLDLNLKDPSSDHQDILDSQFPDPIALKKAGPPKTGAPAKKKAKPKGVSGQGRPGGSKDKKKRDKRNYKPTSKAEELVEIMLYASEAQKAISEAVNPYFLDKFGKNNLRKLTDDQAVELEKTKFSILYNIPYGYDLSSASIAELLSSEEVRGYEEIEEGYKAVADSLRQKSGQELTYEQLGQIKSYVYALLTVGEESDEVTENEQD